jgi:hypothetical protein
MAEINNPQLTVTTHRPQARATVVVSCDLEFTEVEVNAMNLLGMQYTLTCQVLNKDLFDEDPVITYQEQTFPRLSGDAHRNEHAVFETFEAMELLHERLIGKDRLVAQLKLTNEETKAEVTNRTEVIELDLAA